MLRWIFYPGSDFTESLAVVYATVEKTAKKNKPTGFDQTRAKKVLKEAWVMFVSRAKVSWLNSIYLCSSSVFARGYPHKVTEFDQYYALRMAVPKALSQPSCEQAFEQSVWINLAGQWLFQHWAWAISYKLRHSTTLVLHLVFRPVEAKNSNFLNGTQNNCIHAQQDIS